jgi:hypothetical protein
MILVWVLLWLTLAILAGKYASTKGHSGIGFFLVAVVFSPLVAFIITLVVPAIGRKCPHCGEIVVNEDAKVCKHCGKDLPARKEIECPKCSSPVSNYAKRCPECGASLV